MIYIYNTVLYICGIFLWCLLQCCRSSVQCYMYNNVTCLLCVTRKQNYRKGKCNNGKYIQIYIYTRCIPLISRVSTSLVLYLGPREGLFLFYVGVPYYSLPYLYYSSLYLVMC